MPQEPFRDDGHDQGASENGSPIVKLPPKPRIPADQAAASRDAAPADSAPETPTVEPAKKPRAPRAPRTTTPRTTTPRTTTPRTPRAPRATGAASGSTTSGTTASRAKKPATPRGTAASNRAKTPTTPPATPRDPGPPPPLPADLVADVPEIVEATDTDIVAPPESETATLQAEPVAPAAEDVEIGAPADALIIPPKPPLPVRFVAPAEASADALEPTSIEPAGDAHVAVVQPETLEPEIAIEPDVAEPVEPEAAEPEPVAVEPEVVEPEAVESEPETVEPETVEPEVEVTDESAEDVSAGEPTVLDVLVDEPAVDDELVADRSVDEESVAVAAVRTGEREPEASVDTAADVATAVLRVRGITKIFGDTRAVDAIDLTVPKGAFYGLVGPNGAGKTTTLSMIAGLLRPDRGSIEVNGIDAKTDPTGAKRAMGVLPDRLRTFDRLTGRQLLYYYGILRGLAPSVVEARTVDLARAFDLTDALGRVVSDYSAGMAKKVMLAGAMIHSPRLLVLDEPFEAVDPVSSAVILDILGTYVAHGGTVILSSHGMDLVERVCSRVAVIVGGQVLAEGTIDEVRGELTLEQRFIELAGGLGDVEGLEWLHTFSD
ncbi:ATP-binding cassette domain-containing protein [Microbacterium sp. CJ88]|uniref:ABC transporter ATP-binding protein n=1 Tax=Microbacterium sp. CJ88 TaxID=3445672 RepID=UPI003F65FA65